MTTTKTTITREQKINGIPYINTYNVFFDEMTWEEYSVLIKSVKV